MTIQINDSEIDCDAIADAIIRGEKIVLTR